ncbi:protein tipE [Sitodiplosis mosellana]|uniref:protein tipE n=1 Tax=Sitodiplosis mosellana TaxID=263140 RepID=UPI0024451380|nr:protein tipE [Sitodiplosis mosellana]XP_055294833.1 protein tipE [Sitodiplosis mosellana]
MADEPVLQQQTFKEKLLFYITAFFVLLGTFSLFAFLFLVPFVIEPAFTTIFMEFDENPAECVTAEVEHFKGASNCSWTSCREGCTKEVYECTQIRVNYKVFDSIVFDNDTMSEDDEVAVVELDTGQPASVAAALTQFASDSTQSKQRQQHADDRIERAIREYEYVDSYDHLHRESYKSADGLEFMEYPEVQDLPGQTDNTSEWYFTGARLFPNVKGCGYPPILNCSIWTKKFIKIGTNFSCYYSRVDPGLVISDLDLRRNMLNLIYAMFIPIPCFIVSVIYLTFAYFKIYNEDEEAAPLGQNAEKIAGEDEVAADTDQVDVIVPNGTATISVASVPVTPTSNDVASFGHQLKVKMADEMSRESLDGGFISNSGSIQGNLSKTMTTSISTPPGPTAAV